MTTYAQPAQTQQYEKNPNGGYLNPSKFGGHYGKLELTPELIAAAQAKGAIEVKITEEKLNSKGEPYVRITAKEYDDSWKSGQPTQYAPQPVQAAPAPQYAAAPAPAPVLSDEIPF